MNNKNKSQRYYWFKLKLSFLDSPKVDFLMSQVGGANYVVIYQMLCLKAINTNGKLETSVNEFRIKWDNEKVQRECKYFDIDTIRIAMSLFLQLGLIIPDDDGFLQIQEFEELVGSETSGAIEKRIQRRGIEKGIDKRIDNVYQEYRDKSIESRAKILDNTKSLKSLKPSCSKSDDFEHVEDETSDVYLNRLKLFWNHYPKKQGKGNCEKWFKKNKPSADLLDKMIVAIEKQKHSKQWQRDNGQYIPMPFTWLNQKRWEDELETSIEEDSPYANLE